MSVQTTARPTPVGVRTDDEAANPYLASPAPEQPSPAALGVEELSTGECWRLVESTPLARLAVSTPDGQPDVFPINFTVHAGRIYFRSAPGTKLRRLSEDASVAFEVDGADERFHWSVVIHAEAERMDSDDDIVASGVLGLATASPTAKNDYVSLTPVTVTGRRFRRRPERAAHDTKPVVIPHRAPLR
ncbi:pyridoxamine 5'-phosphate oxidase family protein [Microbacterium hominis]|uniref:Pyridoxamine 5'-phosphate oxidase family protein n=1 Tax=Microbacterium hominis TaxID=162426 RepID=A0A7D4UIY6_9MICO|nr:pyridoxamine 5'-phosphate oxidase family protein [Microbacterium hominis]QKJ20468.1 pyridoxamine 5'-phosphate oxidase family protein [Microbacterium hominis]